MTLRQSDLFSRLRRLRCGMSLNFRSLLLDSSGLCPQSGARPLVLAATLLLLTLISAPPALAQEIPAPAPAKPASAQAAPASATPQRTISRPRIRPRAEAQQKFEPKPDTLPTATAASTPATAAPAPALATSTPALAGPPQPADGPLPFMAGNERTSHEQPPSATGLLLRTLGALLLIVGLIVAAAWGMKRFGGARFGTPIENAPPLAVLNSLSLGERRSLTIVRFGDRTLLLGSTAHTVTLLAEAESDDFMPHARPVAAILKDEKFAAFSQELFSATEILDEQAETRRGHHFTA